MVKQGYKPTEIGVIPEDWEVKAIKDCCQIIVGGDVDFNSFSEVTDSKFKYPIFSNTVSNKGLYGYSSNFKVEANSVTVVGRGIGIGTAFPRIGRYTPIGRLIVLDLSNKNINNHFLSNYINSKLEIYDESGGIPQLTGISLGKYQIPLPPLAEQEAIASALSDADAWIDSLEQLIAKKRRIKQGAMQTLLTPPSEELVLSGVEAWEVKKLGEVGKTYGGLSGKTKVDFGKGNAHYIPFMNVMKNVVIDKSFFEKVNLKQGEVQNKVLKNDLLFNGSSETPEELGMSSVILEDNDNLFLNSFCFGFRLFDNNVNPLFLSYLFRSPYGRKIIFYLAQGATRYNLSKANFLELEISIPKSLSEQERIATILSDMDAELEALETQLGKARQIKQGMMQELLTGRTRLV